MLWRGRALRPSYSQGPWFFRWLWIIPIEVTWPKQVTWLSIPQLKLGNIREYSPIFKTVHVAKKIWRIYQNVLNSVWPHFQTTLSSSKILCWVSYFQIFSQCLEMWSNMNFAGTNRWYCGMYYGFPVFSLAVAWYKKSRMELTANSGQKLSECEIYSDQRIRPYLKPWPNGPASSGKWTQVELA